MAQVAIPRLIIPGDTQEQWSGSPQLERLRGFCDVDYYVDPPADLSELARRMGDATLAISPVRVKWTDEALALAPGLKLIVLVAIGTDSVDLAAARARGVAVCNVPGRTAPVVAEHALGLMLSVARRMAADTAALKGGAWQQARTTTLRGKRLGIVGTGHIGAATAQLGRAIGMDVVAWTFSPSPERGRELGVTYVGLDELLATSDVVSLHVRATADTRHLIGARELGLMKRGAILVNVARGAVADTQAVADALASGHLAGVGSDVFEAEPIAADHPWLAHDNVVLTPHVADNTPEGMEFLNEGAVDNVAAFLAGKPTNVVN